MEEMIKAFRADVERTEAAHLRFISMRTIEARTLLDMLEQTSRAQRTTEGECNSVAAPVAADTEQATHQVQHVSEHGTSTWHDATEAAYNTFMPERRRIVYAAPFAGKAPEGLAILCDQLLDIWDDGRRNAPEDRAYSEGALDEVIEEIRESFAAPLATPADAGAGLTAGRLTEAEIVDLAIKRGMSNDDYMNDPAGYCHDFARAIELAVLARMSTPGAPVTAEPAASIDTPGFRAVELAYAKALYAWEDSPSKETSSAVVTARKNMLAHIATHSAPADRDAIRDQALEEAAGACETWGREKVAKWAHDAEMSEDAKARAWDALQCAVAIRALKSMERAADAKGGA